MNKLSIATIAAAVVITAANVIVAVRRRYTPIPLLELDVEVNVVGDCDDCCDTDR